MILMSYKLIDFHCHLDLFPNFDDAIKSAEESKVYTLTVTTTPKAWSYNKDVTSSTRYVRAALGLHPQLISERSNELPLWEKFINETRYIGEVGLDSGPRFYKSIDIQKRVFQRILICCAESGGKILSVHSFRAATLVLDLIERYLPQDRGTIVLHWFTGNNAERSRALKLGCYFSINNKMVNSKNGRLLISSLPIDRILTETDSPFTNDPGSLSNNTSDLFTTIRSIAGIRSTETNEMGVAIENNFRELLGK